MVDLKLTDVPEKFVFVDREGGVSFYLLDQKRNLSFQLFWVCKFGVNKLAQPVLSKQTMINECYCDCGWQWFWHSRFTNCINDKKVHILKNKPNYFVTQLKGLESRFCNLFFVFEFLGWSRRLNKEVFGNELGGLECECEGRLLEVEWRVKHD